MAATDWLLATRPKTLAAGIVPVAVGTALGAASASFQLLPMLACLAAALCIQIGCNFANDALDALKGADNHQRLGPTRAVASGSISASSMLKASAAVLLLAFCIGIYLAMIGGWVLFLLGCISICCAYIYTGGPYPLAYIGLGDLFVFLFFGLVAVMGSAWIQVAGQLSDPMLHFTGLPVAWWLCASCIGLQATAIIAVNNLRDRDTDATAGKRTLAVRMSVRASHIYIGCLHLAAAVCLTAAAISADMPLLFSAAALAGTGGLLLSFGVSRNSGRALNRFLGLSAGLELITGLSIVLSMAH